MKGRPVGVEYLGSDARVVTLSVPLYYLDSADAKTLVEFVVNEKFRSGVGFDEPDSRAGSSIQVNIHPNPARDRVTVEYRIQSRGRVTIELAQSPAGFFSPWTKATSLREIMKYASLLVIYPRGIFCDCPFRCTSIR